MSFRGWTPSLEPKTSRQGATRAPAEIGAGQEQLQKPERVHQRRISNAPPWICELFRPHLWKARKRSVESWVFYSGLCYLHA